MSLFQDSTTFFHVSQSFSRGCPSAKNEPLGHNSSSAASSVQATLRVRLPAASYFPFLLSTPAIDTEGNSSPCGQSPMDFESISLAARTQCLLPARTHHIPILFCLLAISPVIVVLTGLQYSVIFNLSLQWQKNRHPSLQKTYQNISWWGLQPRIAQCVNVGI